MLSDRKPKKKVKNKTVGEQEQGRETASVTGHDETSPLRSAANQRQQDGRHSMSDTEQFLTITDPHTRHVVLCAHHTVSYLHLLQHSIDITDQTRPDASILLLS